MEQSARVQAFIKDRQEVCRRHKLSFYLKMRYEETSLCVNELDESDLKDFTLMIDEVK